MAADLRQQFDRWAEGTRYTHEHFVVDAGKYVGRVPAEEHRDAEVALLDGVPELFDELAEMRSLLAHAACPTCDGRGWYVEPGHACRNEQECMERCPEPVQVQCEWCDRRRTACGKNGSPGITP